MIVCTKACNIPSELLEDNVEVLQFVLPGCEKYESMKVHYQQGAIRRDGRNIKSDKEQVWRRSRWMDWSNTGPSPRKPGFVSDIDLKIDVDYVR